jgi:hypothetical protein
MNIEYRGSGLLTTALLYSNEFAQASSTCRIKFWFVTRGGQSPITAYLVSKDVKEALLFSFSSNGNYTTWQFGASDLGKSSSP